MDGVTQSSKGKAFRVHQPPPVPGFSLNKRRIFLVVASFSTVVAVVMFVSLSPKEKRGEGEAPRSMTSPSPGEVVQGLPNDYSKLIDEMRKEERREVSSQALPVGTLVPSVEEKLLEEARIKRLKNRFSARESDLLFKGVSLNERTERAVSDRGRIISGAGGDGSGVGDAMAVNPRDDDNRQDEKSNFLEAGAGKGDVLTNRVRKPVSKYQLSAGTIIPGVLLTGLNSDLPGQILGQVSQDVFDTVSGRYKLIPIGARVIGEYDSRIVYGQERALIVWTRIIFPNGDSINLEKMPGVDMSGYAGMKDRVNNHYGRLLTGVVMSSLLGAGAQMAQGPNYQTVNPQFDQLALQGAASQINQTGQQITRKNLNIQPTIEIRPGQRFNVFVTRDVVLGKSYS